MRADQILMIGVAGLGAWAVYQLVRRPDPSRVGPSTNTSPTLPILLPIPVNTGPGRFTEVQGPTLALRNSRPYWARVETGSLAQSIFQPGDSADTFLAKVQSLGFEPDTVRVFMNPMEAQALGQPFMLANATPNTRWFYGRWLRPTTTITRPRGLTHVWEGTIGLPLMPRVSGVYAWGRG